MNAKINSNLSPEFLQSLVKSSLEEMTAEIVDQIEVIASIKFAAEISAIEDELYARIDHDSWRLYQKADALLAELSSETAKGAFQAGLLMGLSLPHLPQSAPSEEIDSSAE